MCQPGADWAKGKSEADVVAAINGEDASEVGQALAASKSDPDFFYSRWGSKRATQHAHAY